MSTHIDLTGEFNAGGLRAVLCGDQAVVLHRLAVMSRYGDWILREDEGALRHVLSVLAGRGARYRFGAPLDVRWMEGGWSSHFEFRDESFRVRADFVTRPPRLDPSDLRGMWAEQAGRDIPYLDARRLAEIKKTNREKDYAIIGDLARLVTDPTDRLLLSRSARDLTALAAEHPDLVSQLTPRRPLLAKIPDGLAELEVALDAERRTLIHRNEDRLRRYKEAAKPWAAIWPEVARRVRGLPLQEAHEAIVKRAEDVLPFRIEGSGP